MPELALRRHDAATARQIQESLFTVYAEVYAAQLDDPFYSVERFAERFEGQTSRPGYALVTGHLVDGAELVGYAYGVPLAPTTMWWTGLIEPLPDEFVAEDGTRTFAVNEIMVRAPWRRRGVAKVLHDALLDGRPEQRATLLVDDQNAPARAAYASWGWTDLARIKPFPDAPTYHSLVIDLPVPPQG
jgi:GNAT superfamily N-acetyltransferase